MANRCLDCKEELTGRSDKKFCDDHCRVNYHNMISQERNRQVRSINSILLKNRKLLQVLYQNDSSGLTRSRLQNEGFNFSYHTHIYKGEGETITFTYDYGIVFRKPNLITIVSANS